MGNRNAGRVDPGLGAYGTAYEPGYGMEYYGGSYDPAIYGTNSYSTGRYTGGYGRTGGFGTTGGYGRTPGFGGPAGYGGGFTTTTMLVPSPMGGGLNAGMGNYGLGGFGGIPPKIRAIFIPQGGTPMMGGNACYPQQMPMPMPMPVQQPYCPPPMPMPMPMPVQQPYCPPPMPMPLPMPMPVQQPYCPPPMAPPVCPVTGMPMSGFPNFGSSLGSYGGGFTGFSGGFPMSSGLASYGTGYAAPTAYAPSFAAPQPNFGYNGGFANSMPMGMVRSLNSVGAPLPQPYPVYQAPAMPMPAPAPVYAQTAASYPAPQPTILPPAPMPEPQYVPAPMPAPPAPQPTFVPSQSDNRIPFSAPPVQQFPPAGPPPQGGRMICCCFPAGQ